VHVDLSSDFFDLFGLSKQFEIPAEQLAERFRALQRQLHPDNHSASSDAQKLWSVQAASHVNDGFQTLNNDIRRATYLLQLNGISLDEETDTQMSGMFLMEQMELREALEGISESADAFAALDQLRRELKDKVLHEKTQFARSAQNEDWTSARTIVRQWQFLDKLQREVKTVEEQLDA